MFACLIYNVHIVKIDVTERNGAIKRHAIVITIWRTSTIKVTALPKARFQKWRYEKEKKKKKKKKKKKNLPWMWRTDRKARPSGSQSDITRQTSLCQAVTLGTDFLSTPHTHDRFLHSYFSTIIYFVGTHKKRLVGALLLSTHNICFRREIRKNTDTFWSVKVPYQKPWLMTLKGITIKS